MTTTMTFDRNNGDTAFHAQILIPHLEAGDYVKVTIFGEVVIEKTITTVTEIDDEVYLISTDVSMNQVIIEYVGTPTSPPGSEVLGFAIESYDNVLSGI